MVNSVRGTLRSQGYRLSGGTLSRFIEGYSKARIPKAVRKALDPLMESIVELQDRIDALTREFYAEAKSSDLLQRLQTVPGVGPIVSTAFVCWIDDPSRDTPQP
jgi:transposase